MARVWHPWLEPGYVLVCVAFWGEALMRLPQRSVFSRFQSNVYNSRWCCLCVYWLYTNTCQPFNLIEYNETYLKQSPWYEKNFLGPKLTTWSMWLFKVHYPCRDGICKKFSTSWMENKIWNLYEIFINEENNQNKTTQDCLRWMLQSGRLDKYYNLAVNHFILVKQNMSHHANITILLQFQNSLKFWKSPICNYLWSLTTHQDLPRPAQ